MKSQLYLDIKNMAARKVLCKVIGTLIISILAVIVLVPFVYMLSASFKTMGQLDNQPLDLIVDGMTWKNFQKVLGLKNPTFLRYYFNSFKISGICVLSELLTSSMAGYAFARIRFKGREAIFLLYLATMMIPFQAIMVPQFMVFQYLNIYNTHLALILPRMCTIFGTFMMRQYFMGIPVELSEAAKIDGAGEFKTYYRVILPLAKPALATLGIITFVWRWNEYEAPLIFISEKNLYTLPLALVNFVDDVGQQQDTVIIAAAVCALLPMLLVFFLGQKYIIEGMTSGSVKG
ncbi:aBC transporter permease protein [Hungatella hathewayi CAG:224]|nr:aBC transporter permease protein [Hungatella hathewayi CAG:224]